jgi:Ca2+-dependent lipid-binding protein
VREGRSQRSKTVKNSANPVYNEEFFLLVDDLEKQKLSIKVHHHLSLSPASCLCVDVT